MKKINKTLKVAALAVVSTVFIASSGGSPGQRTGSAVDGGKTCATQGGCHAGRPILSQDVITTDIPASGYAPGESYKITLNPEKEGTSRWGFEMLVQNSDNEAVGSFTSNSDGNIIAGNSDRITHKFASITGGDTKTWVLDWTAPAAGEGDLQIFVSVLAANGNGNTGGDDLIIDTLTISENPTASLTQLVNQEIVLYPNPVVNKLHIKGFDGNATISIFDMTGKEVSTMPYSNVVNVNDLPKGHYILKIVSGNNVLNKTFTKE